MALDYISEVQVYKQGTGSKSLIFLHGGGARYNCYIPLLKLLQKDFTVYCFNLPGHGKAYSDGNVETAIDEVIMEIKSLNLDNIIFVGHSLGAFFALESLRRIRNVTDMILIDPLITTYNLFWPTMFIKFVIFRPVRAIFIDPRIFPFYLRVIVDMINIVFDQGLHLIGSVKLLVNCAKYPKKYNINQYKGIKMSVIFGKKDSIFPVNNLPPEIKKVAIRVKGEHDWCMINPRFTRDIILECLNHNEKLSKKKSP